MSIYNPRLEKVRKTQIAVFKEYGSPAGSSEIIKLLGPEVIAEYLGLEYLEVEQIPSNDPKFRTAGILDRSQRRIIVSNEFPAEQRRLTGMHEVVHWMLHDHIGRDCLHRDRPIGHTPNKCDVEYEEWEATNIACLCLMPEKLVRNVFAETFLLPIGEPIVLNEYAAHFLNVSIDDVHKMNMRKKALTVATTTIYRRPIEPLCKRFRVSPTAMAIRLEELALIDPGRWVGRPNLRIVL